MAFSYSQAHRDDHAQNVCLQDLGPGETYSNSERFTTVNRGWYTSTHLRFKIFFNFGALTNFLHYNYNSFAKITLP